MAGTEETRIDELDEGDDTVRRPTLAWL